MRRLRLAWHVLLTGAAPAGGTPTVAPADEPAAADTAAPQPAPDPPSDASPMVEPMIALLDDVQGAADNLDAPASRALRTVARQLCGILALDHVAPFEDDGRFDPQRQVAISGMATEDPAQDQRVASTVRPGYLRDGVLLRRQDVIVYRLSTGTRG